MNATELAGALTVNDLAASTTWYCTVLGFVVDRKHEREGRVFAVSLRAGQVRLLINQDDGSQGSDRTKGAGFSLQITTSDDIDALAERALAAGASFDTPPTTMPWGVRMFRVRDPDGFRFTVSSPSPHA